MNDIEMGMIWSPSKQVFYCGDENFINHGAAQTDPSHDLAHLLIGANGNLPWKPVGERDLICFAEYNAIVIEHMFEHIFNCVVLRSIPVNNILPTLLTHARWFVEQHYAPFPVSSTEAYHRFCAGLEPSVIIRLCPHFYTLKKNERADPNLKTSDFKVIFTRNDWPTVDGEALKFQELVRLFANTITSKYK